MALGVPTSIDVGPIGTLIDAIAWTGDGFGVAWLDDRTGVESVYFAEISCQCSAQAEICGDNIDNNCDGLVDDSGVGAQVWFEDSDGDTFGNPGVSVSACSQPVGFVANSLDCDDTRGLVNPDATECFNWRDDDCDSEVDEDTLNIVGPMMLVNVCIRFE